MENNGFFEIVEAKLIEAKTFTGNFWEFYLKGKLIAKDNQNILSIFGSFLKQNCGYICSFIISFFGDLPTMHPTEKNLNKMAQL